MVLGGIYEIEDDKKQRTKIPALGELPYVNRLFKNVGTGRETQGLVLMVTPRIIIQEEEE